MGEALHRLRRADQAAGAAHHHLAGRAHGVAATDRAGLGEDVGLRAGGALVRQDGDDLRNHIAGALDDHGVAGADVLAGDFVFVVQRGACHQHPADIDRQQFGDGRERAGAPDLDVDRLQHCDSLFGGEFPGDRPARSAADEAEAFLQREIVDLIHYAIDIVAEAGTGLADFLLESGGLVLAVQAPR